MNKLTKDKVIELAEANNKEFCSSEYIGAEFNYKFKCLDCNRVFTRSYRNFYINKSCPLCKKDSFRQYNKLDLDHWKSVAQDKGLEILSKYYKNARSPIDIRCLSCDMVFSNSPCNIKAGSGCPSCSNGTSKIEDMVRKIFESKFNKKFPTCRPNFLKNPKTKNNLELDGYCEELKLAFEYDGEFHYKENPYRKGGLVKQKGIDSLKDKLCKSEGITLMRIPYYEKDNLEIYINRQLKSKY